MRTLSDLAGADFVAGGTALRDASGRLTFVSDRAPKDELERKALAEALGLALGPYARAGRPILFRGDAGAEPILEAADRLPIQVADVFCHLLDRRIVGSGWLDAPAHKRPEPPRVVFATLKGGVGRSTALAVTAADFARRNRNVLVVDLDLEAPGLGNLLLDNDGTPEFGVIDYLVEDGIGGVTEADLRSYVASSKLTEPGGGRVDVLPALGLRSLRNPENILQKLSRAMIEDVIDGRTVPVSEQISTMISRIAERQQYDAIFIDSRAGLAELAAPAVLGLGATVLFFGTAQKQTIEGYRALFAALQLLAQRDRAQGRDAEWRTRLRPVLAKTSLAPGGAEQYLEDMYEIYSAHIYDAETVGEQTPDSLRFVQDDKSAPHWPLIIPFSQSFVDFDPGRIPGQLVQSFYEQTFRSFLTEIEVAMTSDGDIGGTQP
ncbi:AAA family ATPase [Methylobacterium sp. WL103]|uniref:KGGVGR-motif variant AAA ATPase n=1 Tax=Methylobacterium sp. WL103 TaxID=2603891 RepID=UPI001AEDD574|nr:AAA family ATPase [Methylobacterium sp. WL103]